MISVKTVTENNLKQLRIVNEHSGEYISVVPDYGANVNGIVLSTKDKLCSLLAGNHQRSDFTGTQIFAGAFLLPFPNRLQDGQYLFDGNTWQLEKNYYWEDNAAHGFIYNKPFIMDSFVQEAGFSTLKMKYDYDGDLPGYPFPLSIGLWFTLTKKHTFRCQVQISNKGEQPAPVGFGWHPYFTFNRKVDDIRLKMNVKNRVEVNSRLIPKGKRSGFHFYDEMNVFGAREFDDCFEIVSENGIHETVLSDPENDLTLVLSQETGSGKFNYLQLYIPPARDKIAVEPMSCNINAFNNQDGLIVLGRGESVSAGFGVTLR